MQLYCFTSAIICGAYGQNGVVSIMRTSVLPSRKWISRMSPRSITDRPISGSITVSSAALTPGTRADEPMLADADRELTEVLRQAGFRKVKNLKGGILDWIDKVDPSQPKY